MKRVLLYFFYFSCFFYLNLKANELPAPPPPTSTPSASAGEGNLTIVAVGDAAIEKEKIAILPTNLDAKISSEAKTLITELDDLISNDFAFYRKTFMVPNYKDFKETNILQVVPDFDSWSLKMVNFLIQSSATVLKGSNVEIRFVVFDIKQRKEVFSGSFSLNSEKLRDDGHKMANDIYKVITGKESIFNSKIAFVCEEVGGKRGEPIKELYIMDFDGYRAKKLTNYKSTVFSPAISDDKTKIAFSLITETKKKQKNIDLHLLDVQTGATTPLATYPGINSGAIFLPDSESVALTLSISGNADIYILNIRDKNLRKITNHFSDDVDPSFSPDGKVMAFLSGRPGKAMIYTLDPSGEELNVKRIGFVGKFNATPRYSPNGQEIVFGSWVDNSFDIYRMNSQGQELVRLTKDFGSNEDPSFSGDGQFIAFSSTRILSSTSFQQNVYIMDRDGEILGSVTKNLGNCQTPRWSK